MPLYIVQIFFMSENIKLRLQSDALEMESPIVEEAIVRKDVQNNYSGRFKVKISEVRNMLHVICYLEWIIQNTRTYILYSTYSSLILNENKLWHIMRILTYEYIDGRKWPRNESHYGEFRSGLSKILNFLRENIRFKIQITCKLIKIYSSSQVKIIK